MKTLSSTYLLSPEFQRHVWLKFSMLRLLAVPVFILCACYAIVTFYGDDWAQQLRDKGLIIYYILVVTWGNYEAANVLREEVRGNTWDFQRMSPMSPASMIFGKLFGATSYVWYAALPVLAVSVFAWTQMEGTLPLYDKAGVFLGEETFSPSFAEAFYTVFFMVMAGVMGHALTFLVSFEGMVGKVHFDPRNRQPRTLVAFLMGMAVSHGLYNTLGEGFIRSFRHRLTSFEFYPEINWYGLDIASSTFTIVGALFLLFWLFMGIYRLARAELMYSLTPICWFLGIGSLSLFVAGGVYDPQFLPEDNLFGRYKMYAFFFYLFISTLAATYYAVLSGASDLRKYARFKEALQKAKLRDVFENMHMWVASAFLVLMAYVAFMACLIKTGVGVDLGVFNLRMFITLVTSLLLFAVRDMIVLHLLAAWRGERAQTFERIAYYVGVYFLLPCLHISVSIKGIVSTPAVALGLSQQTAVFHPIMYVGWYYPNFFAKFTAGLLPVMVQVTILVTGIVVFRVLRRKQSGVAA